MLCGSLVVIVWLFCSYGVIVFFFKQKTAYEMRISDWSSDVCSSDLVAVQASAVPIEPDPAQAPRVAEHLLVGHLHVESLHVAHRCLLEQPFAARGAAAGGVQSPEGPHTGGPGRDQARGAAPARSRPYARTPSWWASRCRSAHNNGVADSC